jgi:hypothetical protein
MNRLHSFVLVCVGCCALAAPVGAQVPNRELPSREIIRLLNEPIDMRDFFQVPMTLKEFAGLLYEKYQAKGHELPLLVDVAGFTQENFDFYEMTVLFPPYPKSMSAMTALRLALSQSPVEATYLIRQGRIEVVPASRATLPHLLKQRVTADFSRMPFAEAVHALAEMTGVSIQIDSRLPAKESPAVTATFRNDMSLRDVLRVIADLGGAQVTELETGVILSASCARPEKSPAAPSKKASARDEAAIEFIVSQEGDVAAAAAPEKRPLVAKTSGSAELLRRMREPIATKDLQQQMTLKEALGIFYRAFQDKGVEVPILVDQQSFKVANPDAPDLYETVVLFPPWPKQLSLAQALRIMLAQIPTGNATYWVRDGFIEITTQEALSFDQLKSRFVQGHFDRQPAHSVIADLAEQSGVSIVVDSRVEEKLNAPVNLTLRNNVSVHDALRTLADMSGLRLVELPTSFYITSASSPLGEEMRKLMLMLEGL